MYTEVYEDEDGVYIFSGVEEYSISGRPSTPYFVFNAKDQENQICKKLFTKKPETVQKQS